MKQESKKRHELNMNALLFQYEICNVSRGLSETANCAHELFRGMVTAYDLCKFRFANSIVNIWNSLPSYVVSAETVNCFKTRLDSLKLQ